MAWQDPGFFAQTLDAALPMRSGRRSRPSSRKRRPLRLAISGTFAGRLATDERPHRHQRIVNDDGVKAACCVLKMPMAPVVAPFGIVTCTCESLITRTDTR